MFFSAIDCSAFPGLDTLEWIKAKSGISAVGFYLPAPSHPEEDWMPHRTDLAAMELGFIPIYVGQQLTGEGSHFVSAEQGNEDGADAADSMKIAGFPAKSWVYLDLEDGPPFSEPRVSYVKYWALAVANIGYQPGVYCSHAMADQLALLLPNARLWPFKVATVEKHPLASLSIAAMDPAGSGYAKAAMWQHEQNAVIATPHGDVMVDVTTSRFADPSAP